MFAFLVIPMVGLPNHVVVEVENVIGTIEEITFSFVSVRLRIFAV
jgi:hypothetical protein